MEIRVLQYFLAVAREESLSGAAEYLHLSQPTLSRQLRDLEEELGKQLFVRTNRGISLTEEGLLLRKRAEEIILLVKKTEDEIALSDDLAAGDVYIGAGESMRNRHLARAACWLKERYPAIRFHISSGNAVFVMEQLDKGLIDFGLVYGPVDSQKYHSLPLPCADSFGVLMRRDASLAGQESVTLEDLRDKPLIISSQEERDGFPLLRQIAPDVSALNIAATYTLIFNASLLVEEGMGYALCLEGLINTSGDSRLCFRPLSPPQKTTAALVWKKYQILSNASQRFLEAFEKRFC